MESQSKGRTRPRASGSQVTFNFNITAPANVGYYHFQWRMLQENVEWFGSALPPTISSASDRQQPPPLRWSAASP